MTAPKQGPTLAVSVAVWSTEHSVRVQRGKPPNQGLWALPGGKVKFGETLAKAAIREMQEETGLAVAPQKLFLVKDIISLDFHYNLHCITAKIISGELAAADDAHSAKWVPYSELGQLPTVPDLATSVTLSKNGPFLPI